MTTEMDRVVAGHRRRARQSMSNLQAIIRRAELGQTTGRNWGASKESACWRLKLALRAIVAIEDAQGTGAAAPLADRLTALRQRAMRAELLTAEDVIRIEREVCS